MSSINSSSDTSEGSPQGDLRDKLGAVRMVAFGVLEFENGVINARTHEMQELLQTINKEFQQLNWKFAVQARRRQFNSFILLGPLYTGDAFSTREKIGEGTLQEVCKAAIAYIDREAPYPDDSNVF